MSLNKRVRPYEILFRFDERTGEFRAAHVQTIEVIEEDGSILAATPQPAMPLERAAGLGFALDDLIDGAAVDAVRQRDAAILALNEVRAIADTQADSLRRAQTIIADLREKLAAQPPAE